MLNNKIKFILLSIIFSSFIFLRAYADPWCKIEIPDPDNFSVTWDGAGPNVERPFSPTDTRPVEFEWLTHNGASSFQITITSGGITCKIQTDGLAPCYGVQDNPCDRNPNETEFFTFPGQGISFWLPPH